MGFMKKNTKPPKAPAKAKPKAVAKASARDKTASAAAESTAPAEAAAVLENPVDVRFERLRQLGRGSYGVAWLVKRKADQQLLAMKSITLPPLASSEEKARAERQQAIREVEALEKLKSPHIVRYVEMVLCPPSAENACSELHILTEYCEAGDLANYIKLRGKGGIEESEIWRLSVHILAGLNDLHRNQILHRDLKPANIFLKRVHVPSSRSPGKGKCSGAVPKAGELRPLLGDLGLARTVTDSQPLATTLAGTPHYCAPEIFEGVPYDQKADVYSFGVCVYEIMHGSTPHADVQNIVGLIRRVLRLDLGGSCNLASTAPIDARFSPELRDLVLATLEQKPEARPSGTDLMERVPEKYRLSFKGSKGNPQDSNENVTSIEDESTEITRADSGGSSSSYAFRPPSRSNSRDEASAVPANSSSCPDSVASRTVEKPEMSELDKTLNKEATFCPAEARNAISLERHSDKLEEMTLKEVKLEFADSKHTRGHHDTEQSLSDVLSQALLLASTSSEKPQLSSTKVRDKAEQPREEEDRDSEQGKHDQVATERSVPADPRPSPKPVAPVAAANLTVASSASLVAGTSVESNDEGHCNRFLREQQGQRSNRGLAGQRDKSGRRDLLQYVARAQECWSRWRRERLDAIRKPAPLGAKAAPSAAAAGGKVRSPKDKRCCVPDEASKFSGTGSLEIRGFASRMSPKPTRQACRV